MYWFPIVNLDSGRYVTGLNGGSVSRVEGGEIVLVRRRYKDAPLLYLTRSLPIFIKEIGLDDWAHVSLVERNTSELGHSPKKGSSHNIVFC